MKRIASRDNAHFRDLKKLCQSSRERRKSGRIVLDGMHLIESYVEKLGQPDEIVVSESGASRSEIGKFLEDQESGQAITVLADSLFNDLASVETPSGIMAVVARPHSASALDQEEDALVLDGIQDPGNLGSILRTAAAAGFRQVLLSADCAQAWAPKTLRAGMGAHFQLDIHDSCDLPGFLAGYRGQVLVTALEASEGLFSLALNKPLAWVFGSEGQGVRPEVMALATQRVRIPMAGSIESLNVAAAAAVCLFETLRQRTGTL